MKKGTRRKTGGENFCSFAAQLDKRDEEIRVIDITLAYPGKVSQVMCGFLRKY